MRQQMLEEKEKKEAAAAAATTTVQTDPYAMDSIEDAMGALPPSRVPSKEVKSRFDLLDERLKRKLEYFRDLYFKSLKNREKPYSEPKFFHQPLYLCSLGGEVWISSDGLLCVDTK